MDVEYRAKMTYLSADSLSRLILWNMVQYSGNSLRLGYMEDVAVASCCAWFTNPYIDTRDFIAQLTTQPLITGGTSGRKCLFPRWRTWGGRGRRGLIPSLEGVGDDPDGPCVDGDGL